MGLFSGLFGGGKPKLTPFDLSRFGFDMHSHLIPGIDDGARNMDETIAMLAKFESLGYKRIVTTPHVMSDYYRNTPEIILGGLEEVRKTAQQLNLSIEIGAAAEYYYDESLMDRLKKKENLLTFGDKYLLFEFSFHAEPGQIEALFFELLTQGYKPVLAHVERYAYLFGDLKRITSWRKQGILLQMNLNSAGGHYGPEVQKQALAMIDAGLVDFVSTDCHRMEHLLILERNCQADWMHKLGALPLLNTELLNK